MHCPKPSLKIHRANKRYKPHLANLLLTTHAKWLMANDLGNLVVIYDSERRLLKAMLGS